VLLRNHTGEAVKVTVRGHFGGTWRVLQESDEGKNPDAFTREWVVEVGPNSQKKLTYTVREG